MRIKLLDRADVWFVFPKNIIQFNLKFDKTVGDRRFWFESDDAAVD